MKASREAVDYSKLIQYIINNYPVKDIYHLPRNPTKGSFAYVVKEETFWIVIDGEWVEIW